MSEYTSNQVDEVEQAAQHADANARKARNEVKEAISHMNAERHYSEDPSQNKR